MSPLPVPPTQGDFEFFSLLSHSAVKKLPWIRFLLPPDARPDGPGPLGWNMEHVLMSNRGPPPTDDLRIGNPDLYREVCLADAKLRAHVDAGGEGPKADLRRCGIAAFLYPSPRLQHLVAPLLPAIDDTRRRCGALVGVHLRSGFADLADYIGHNLHPPPPGAPGANGTAVPETAAEAVMNAWAILSNATRPCPQRRAGQTTFMPSHPCAFLRLKSSSPFIPPCRDPPFNSPVS